MVYLNRNAAADLRNANTIAQIRAPFDDQLDALVPPSPEPAPAPTPAPVAPSYDLGNDPLTSPDMAASQPVVASPQPEPAAATAPPAAQTPPASSFTPPGMAPVSYDGGVPAPQPSLAANTRGRDLATNQFSAGLSYADALAACGPTAAQALARAYGNDIPIDQVLAAAKRNGWDQNGGMNGIQNQKRLMDQLGIPSRLDTSPDWGSITRDAQSGNPVIISTTKHYYVLSDYDAQSGKFYVGETGLAFKNGSRWMSLSEIQSQGNGINGALFADAPISATPSVAAKPNASTPQDWQSQFSGMLEGAVHSAGEAVNAAGKAKGQAAGAVVDWGAKFGEMLDSSLKGLTEPKPMSTAPIQDQVPSYVRDYAAANGSQVADNPYVGVQPTPRDTMTPGELNQRVYDFEGKFTKDLGGMLPGGQLTVPQDVPILGGIKAGDVVGEMIRPTNIVTGEILGAGLKAAAGTAPAQAAGKAIREGAGQLADTAGDLLGRIPAREPAQASTRFAAGNVVPEGFADDLIRRFDDRDIGLRRFEENTAKLISRELTTDERPSLLTRLSADPAAKVKIDEGLKPAIQSVQRTLGDQGFDDLSDLIVSRNNVDVAAMTGQKVQQAVMDAPMRVAREGDLAKAKSAFQMRERMLTAAEAGGDEATQKVAARNLQLAQRRVDRLTQTVEENRRAALQQRAAEAQYAGSQAASGRKFSGGINAAQSEAAVQRLEQNATVKTAADQVSNYVGSMRDRLVKAGVWSQDFAAQMAKEYPNWAPTRILDYMSEDGGQRLGGKGLSLRDSGLRRYSIEGTERLRQNPIEALVDYSFQVERMARKNEAAAAFKSLDDLRPAAERVLRKVTSAYKPTADEATFEFFDKGIKQRFVAPKAIAESINGASVMPVPEWAGKYGDFVRAVVTQRNPVFLAGNTALDVPEYLMTSYVAEGANPTAAPKILWELAKGYGRALNPKDVLKGEWSGAAADFMKAGGGQSGMYQIGNKAARQTVAQLRRDSVFEIKGKADVARLIKQAASLKPVEALGERLEQGPRIAAYNLAKKRGETAVSAAIKGREVTIDFSRGGEVTKYINQFVPFFNVAFQGPSKVIRTFGNNPAAASLAAAQLIGIPTIAAEAWNNSDPQRAADYKNVSDYYKRTGVVIMLDGTTDAEGNRVPQFVHINLRNWAGLAQIARQAADMGGLGTPREWSKFLLEGASSMSPIGGSGPADFANSLTTMFPGVGTASQLSQDKDVFRNTQIATKSNDDRAGGTARAISDTINTVRAPFTAERVRPSQVDFAIKDLIPGLGATALSAGDRVFGEPKDKRQTPGDIPIVGGLVGRFIKAGGNQQLYDAREQVITPAAKQALEQAGVPDYNPSAVPDKAYTADLTNVEQTRWQQIANVYVNEAILNLTKNEKFLALGPEERRAAVLSTVQQARDAAKDEVVQGLSRELPRPEGQPAKYQGVADYKQEIAIDNAISAVNAWEANRRRGAAPSQEEQVLARRYEGRISQLYSRWSKGEREQSREIKSIGAPAPTAVVGGAPAPGR